MKRIFAGVFLIIETIMLSFVIFSFVYSHFFKEGYTGTSAFYGAEKYPIVEEYGTYRTHVLETLEKNGPALETDVEKTDNNSSNTNLTSRSDLENNLITVVSNKIRSIEGKIEKYTNSNNIIGKRLFVAAKKKFDKFAGLDMTSSQSGGQNDSMDVRDVIGITADGQLGWIQDDMDITERIENMIAFGLQMKEEGRKFVILENPNKYASIDGYTDYSMEKYEQIHSAAAAYGIDLIQAGEEMKKMGMTNQDIFFNTDFHWKPSAGIVADKILCEYLNKNTDYKIDTSLFDLDSYETEVQVDGFLGYLGKKVTLEYTDAEDFYIISPKYETDLTVWNSFDGSEKNGTIQDTLFWQEQLDVDSLYDGNKYEFYGYSDQALIQVHNNLVNDGRRMLVIKTSFANCMTPFLTSAVENLDIIDLRAFDGSVQHYINETNPDTIVLVYGLSSYEDDTLEGGLFDFR